MNRKPKPKLSSARWFSVDADHDLLANHLSRSMMTSEGIPVTLKTPQPMASQQRRGSFLYRSEVGDSEGSQQQQQQQSLQQQQQFLAMPVISIHSNTPSMSASPTCVEHIYPEDPIITPFAQILQRLQMARNSYVELTKVTDRRRRRSSNYNTEVREVNYIAPSSVGTKYPEEFSLEILDDLDWCLDQLEAIQTNRSVGDLATTKFKKILTKELNQLAESSKSGGLISEYISNTFLDKEDEQQLESNSVVAPSPPLAKAAAAVAAATSTTTATVGQCTIMCQIPGVKKIDGTVQRRDDVPRYGAADLDEASVREYMADMNQWNFDIFRLDEISNSNSLVVMAFTILKERNLLTAFRIPPVTMATYLRLIQSHYGLESFYHNRLHAADVTHAVHVILNKAPQLQLFSDLEILSAIFAAVVHDVDHPGVTNPYLINTNSDLALMYNDESVLENHHLAVAFKLLQEKNCDIFVNISVGKRRRIRKMVIDMVLATDMTKHMRLLADLKTKVETKKLSGADMLVTDNYNDRMEILKCLLHCADLGNPTKSLYIYTQWVDRVLKEFFNQGDIERGLGLEISPMCDRFTASIEKSQVSFIEYIVHPLWETLAELVDPYCNDILDTIEENKNYFQNLATQNCTSPVLKPDSDGRGCCESEGNLFVFQTSGTERNDPAVVVSSAETTDGKIPERREKQISVAEEQQRPGEANEKDFVKSTVTITIQKE